MPARIEKEPGICNNAKPFVKRCKDSKRIYPSPHNPKREGFFRDLAEKEKMQLKNISTSKPSPFREAAQEMLKIVKVYHLDVFNNLPNVLENLMIRIEKGYYIEVMIKRMQEPNAIVEIEENDDDENCYIEDEHEMKKKIIIDVENLSMEISWK